MSRYARVGKTIPDMNLLPGNFSKLGRSRFFAPMPSTAEDELDRVEGTLFSTRVSFKDNNSILSELTPEIRNLDLSDLRWLKSATLPKVGMNCPNLKTVNFRNLRQMNDAALIALGEGCPRIASVDLSGCSGISSNGLLRCVDRWIFLRQLKLHGCAQLFDKERGFGSPSAAVAWQQIIEAAKNSLEAMINVVPAVKATYLVYNSILRYPMNASEENEGIERIIRGSLAFVSSKQKKRSKKMSVFGKLIASITTDEDGDVELDPLFSIFKGSEWELDGDAQKDIMRSFMKEGVNTREKENFRRFVQALLNVVGKEEYHSILQVCYERATEMSDRNTEVKTLGHFVSDFETKKNSYKDLGKGLLNVISRSNKHLTELDLSYCTSLGPHQLLAWSAPSLTESNEGPLGSGWHEYNKWVLTGEWTVTEDQLQQTAGLAKAEEQFEIDRQDIQDQVATYQHKSSMFFMEINELKQKAKKENPEGELNAKQKKDFKTLDRKLQIAEKNLNRVQEKMKELVQGIESVRQEAADALADLAEGTRKHAPLPRAALKTLDLSGCYKIDDAGVAWITALCPDIEIIKFVTCNQQCLTSEGMGSVARACESLRSLDLSGCTQLAEKAVKQLTTWCSESLRAVSFAGTKSINFQAFLQKCPGVENLDLDGCLKLSEKDLSAILAEGKKRSLKRLSVNNCPKLSNKAVESARAAYPSIRLVKTLKVVPKVLPTAGKKKVSGKKPKKKGKSKSPKKKKK
jgi:hypothetical protein